MSDSEVSVNKHHKMLARLKNNNLSMLKAMGMAFDAFDNDDDGKLQTAYLILDNAYKLTKLIDLLSTDDGSDEMKSKFLPWYKFDE